MHGTRLNAIKRTHRHAIATRPTVTDSWLNGYRDDVGDLLGYVAALEDRLDPTAIHDVRRTARRPDNSHAGADA